MEKFLYLLLFLHPFILPASGCVGVGSGCLRNGLIFGGRLMVSGNTGMSFGNLPNVNGDRVFIFQTPPGMRNFLRPSAGRGQIWIGRSNCAGTVPGHCPSTETPPCLDASPPCEPNCNNPEVCPFVLNVDEKSVLTFTWERPTCVPENEALTYSYLFWMDGNTETGTTTETRKIFQSFYSDSKYFFEVNVTTSRGSFSNYTSKASPAYADNTPLTFLDVTASGVTVTWPVWNAGSDKGLGPIAEYIIQYRLKGASEFARISKGLAYQHRFEGLISGATYEFQVIIVKSSPSEEGDPSAIQEVQISCPAPTGASLSLSTDYRPSDKSVGIYASWSVGPSSFCAAGLDQTLTVQLLNRDSCDASPNQMTFDQIIMGGDVRDYTLRYTPPVIPNSLYRVTITIGNTLGTAFDTQTIQTAESVPTLPPVLLDTPVTLQPPQITFNWNEPPCGGRNGEITDYEYVYRVWGEGSTQPVEMTGVAPDSVVTLNYTADSRYTFSVRAQTANGAGGTDTFAVIDPPRYKDDTPLTFYDVTSSSISVSWPAWDESVGFGQGPVVDYILQYRLQTSGSDFMEVNKGSDLSHQVTNVVAGGLYEFRIKLVKSGPQVEGPPSSVQQSIACEGIGDLIPQLGSSRLHPGNTSLDVNWVIPTSACQVINQILIIRQLDEDRCYYDGENEKMTSLAAHHRNHLFTGMKPNTEYNVTLQMQTGSKWFSVSEKIRTAETEPTGTPLNMMEKRRVGKITFWWDPPNCGERNGVVYYHYYMIRNGELEEGDTGRKRVKTIMGLNEGDSYSFKVQAYTKAGTGSYNTELKDTFSLG
ncbi:Receptor-type tyrosine-protein phosphatase F [Holothuria leucospilota]|uniref:Receptor-type tyrosine-protein phosphatase F n=1 Tax=Holothuria leucospilota TaxID=206669 RepID=A0A9Q1H201_HOLLE|nr:Receptor-type tyrosine-protein phosphatase F [Holothuria leucospilota]